MIKIALNTQHWIIWLALLMVSVCGMTTALIAQYVFDMQPCYLCIYQRIGLCLIGAGALLGLIFRLTRGRFLAMSIVYAGIGIGITSGAKLLYKQSQPSEYGTCAMGAEQMIELFGWIEALPILFNATGDCGVSSGEFLSIRFETWSLALFFAILLVVVTAGLLKHKD
jgi:disulfide bond formation protein DsbB